MKKIIFFIPYGVHTSGGAERVLTVISNMLSRENFKVYIITNNAKESFYKLDNSIDIMSLGLNKSKNFIYRKIQPIFYMFKFRSIICEINPDYIISFGCEATISKYIALIGNKKIKKIAWEHNSYYQPNYKILKVMRRIIYPKLHKVFVLNKTDKNAFEEFIKLENVKVIPNPVPWKNNEKNLVKEKNIISVGRLQKVKGFERLIEIFNGINERNPDWKLIIVGKDEGEKSNLLAKVKKYSLDNKIEFVGEVKNIKELYNKSSLFLMTSYYECFPMVLLEAKECGLPIVAFDCNSGPRDIIINEMDGYLVKDGDIDEYVEKANIIVGNIELRESMSEKAVENVKQYYIENIKEIWLKELNI